MAVKYISRVGRKWQSVQHLTLNFGLPTMWEYKLLEAPVSIGFNGTIDQQNVRVNIPLKTSSGTGKISLTTKLPRNILETSRGSIEETKIDFSLDRVKMTNEDIKKMLSYRGTGQGKGDPFQEKEYIPFPNFTLNLSGKDIQLGETNLWIEGRDNRRGCHAKFFQNFVCPWQGGRQARLYFQSGSV